MNRRALQQKYPAIRGFVVTDCEPQLGLDTLRAAVEREVDAPDHLRDPFPQSWFDIKERLAGTEKNLSQDTFDEFR